MKTITEVLAARGYAVEYDEEEFSDVLVHADQYIMISSITEEALELALWDSFSNGFKPADFSSTEDYATAIIQRFHTLADEYFAE